jgi:multidrug efflux pump subunit AcrA (membrane-fusion protein)
MFEIHFYKKHYALIANFRNSSLAILIVLAGSLAFLSGCKKEKTAAAGPPEVEVFEVVQKDVPITKEWVATLSGFVNADIRMQVSGYLMKQTYTNGDYVRKGANFLNWIREH